MEWHLAESFLPPNFNSYNTHTGTLGGLGLPRPDSRPELEPRHPQLSNPRKHSACWHFWTLVCLENTDFHHRHRSYRRRHHHHHHHQQQFIVTIRQSAGDTPVTVHECIVVFMLLENNIVNTHARWRLRDERWKADLRDCLFPCSASRTGP